jgi:hypothetical protein
MTIRRLFAAATVAALAVLVLPVTAGAALLWTLVGTPLTAATYQSTTFSFTATNLDLLSVLGCLEVDMPASFQITGTGTPNASNGDTWVTSLIGNAVVVRSINGGGRLKLLETVTFSIQARPMAAGAFALPNHSHVRQDCTSSDQPGVALPITVLPGATPTPTPSPTPSPTPRATPTPTPTQRPTPVPLPVPTLPLPTLPVPTLPLPSQPGPSDPLPSVLPTPSPPSEATATPGATGPSIVDASPIGSASPRPTPTPVASGSANLPPAGTAPGGGTSAGGTAGAPAAVRLEPQELTLDTQLLDILGTPQVWFVPAAAIGAPGLLVLLWVALQTVGTLAWIPSVRRMRGQDRPAARGGARRLPRR